MAVALTHETGWQWTQRRNWWAARLPQPCTRCGLPVEPGMAWDLDHYDDDDQTRADHRSAPAHASCNRAAGLAKANRHRARRLVSDGPNSGWDTAMSRFLPGTPNGPGCDDVVWDRADWLRDLRDEARASGESWPRLMSAPHPNAVGSLGPDAIALTEAIEGRPVRWWQRLALTRALECDALGRLVWLWVLLSTPRQVGKTWLLRGACMWRVHQADRFGEPQDVLHTAKDLPVTREAMRPAKAWARRHKADGWKVWDTNGRDEVAAPDGSRWLARGRDSVYSYGASLGVVDEAWKVSPAVVDDGLEPTMAERADAQGLLVSTAHRRATALFPSRRQAAAAELLTPGETLLIEWSAPPGVDIEDRAAWRLASPYWSERRERILESKLARAQAGDAEVDEFSEGDPVVSFRSQWLNVWGPWPPDVVDDGRDESLADDADWAAVGQLAALPPAGPLSLAVVDYFGRGCATAAAGRNPDGRVFVWGRVHSRRVEGLAWVAMLADTHPGSTLYASASLVADTADIGCPVVVAGASESRAGLAALRESLADGRVCHDGGSDLAAQIHAARVTNSSAGLRFATRSGRNDLVTAAAWVLNATRAAPVDFFVY